MRKKSFLIFILIALTISISGCGFFNKIDTQEELDTFEFLMRYQNINSNVQNINRMFLFR